MVSTLMFLHEFYINSIHSSFQFTCNYSKESVHFLDVSVSVDNSGNITTDLYVKPTDTQQYQMATSCHPNHTKRSIPYCQALRILRICSSKESAKLRRTELVDCLVKRGYNKRKTNKQIECAFTSFANRQTGRQCHTTRPVYFNVQSHPGLPDIKAFYKGICLYCINLSQCNMLFQTYLLLVLANLIISVAVYVGLSSVKPLVLMMSHLDHHKFVANRVVNYAYR